MVEPDGQSEHQLTPRRLSCLFVLLSGSSQMSYGETWTGMPLTSKPASAMPFSYCFWAATASGSTS